MIYMIIMMMNYIDDDEDDDIVLLTPIPKKRKIIKKSSTPKQDEVREFIESLNKDIDNLEASRNKPFISISAVDKKIKEKKEQQKKLKRLRQLQKASKVQRTKQKKALNIFKKQNPDDNTVTVREGIGIYFTYNIGDIHVVILMIYTVPGHPPVECYAPHFGAVLMEIINNHCKTDPRRQSEMITACDSLKKLAEQARHIIIQYLLN